VSAVALSLAVVAGLASAPFSWADAATPATTSMPSWYQLSPASSPAPRDSAAVAFDSGTGQLLLFGGRSQTDNFADTWTWDGINWDQLSPSTSPSARNYAAMAYDQSTGQMVLFGGSSTTGPLGDTWLWTGTTWVQQNPKPAGRHVDMVRLNLDATGADAEPVGPVVRLAGL
jgi:hypothetical protein